MTRMYTRIQLNFDRLTIEIHYICFQLFCLYKSVFLILLFRKCHQTPFLYNLYIIIAGSNITLFLELRNRIFWLIFPHSIQFRRPQQSRFSELLLGPFRTYLLFSLGVEFFGGKQESLITELVSGYLLSNT